MTKMKQLRVVLLVHDALIPPDYYQELSDEDFNLVKTEYDVRVELENYGHDVRVVGLDDSLTPLTHALTEFEPDIVFNLLEEFQDQRERSHAVIGYLEAMGVAYAGCNPRALALAQDKAMAKAILSHYGIPTPGFRVVPVGRPPTRRGLEFPIIVKSLRGDALEGLSQASVVHSDRKLGERIELIHRHHGDALVEAYVPGREVYCSVVGNRQLETFPLWELRLTKLRANVPNIATQRIKWDLGYQDRVGLEIGKARRVAPAVRERIEQLSKRAYTLLGMTGWGRMDFRLTDAGEPFLLEANPNADIAHDEEFARSAKLGGYSYIELLHRIIRLGLRAAER